MEPTYRAYAPVLYSLRQKGVGYLNVSPAPATHATIGAQGFSRLFRDRFLALPALGLKAPSLVIRDAPSASLHLPEPEHVLLEVHAALGCLSSFSKLKSVSFVRLQTNTGFQTEPSLVATRPLSRFERLHPVRRFSRALPASPRLVECRYCRWQRARAARPTH